MPVLTLVKVFTKTLLLTSFKEIKALEVWIEENQATCYLEMMKTKKDSSRLNLSSLQSLR